MDANGNSSDRDDALGDLIGAAFGADEIIDRDTIHSILRASAECAMEEAHEPNRRLEDRYEVLDEISRGGMGVVKRARDRALDRRVAIKMLTERASQRPGMAHRLVEEAKICGRLEHPGIVPLHDFGFLEDGDPFLVMRLVEGKTLAAMLAEREDRDEDQLRFLQIFEEVCRATAYAHEHDVLHRDLKPSNVMVGAFGETQVMDWGLARHQRSPAERLATSALPGPAAGTISAVVRESQYGSVIGTASYMSPEQARGEADVIDERSDVFSLGSILLEVLTGRPAFKADTVNEILALAAAGDLDAAWRDLAANGPDPELDQLVRACLAPDPSKRLADAAAVAAEMASYLASLEERRQEAEVASAAAAAKAAEERRARKLSIALILLIAVVIVGSAGGYLWRDAERRREEGLKVRRVDGALNQAQFLADQARTDDNLISDDWTAAIAAAHEALALAEGIDTTSASDLVAELESEWETRKRISAAAVELEEIRPHLGNNDGTGGIEARFDLLFESLGIDVESEEIASTVERIQESPIATVLITALDDWREARRRHRPGVSPQRLLDIAMRADAHPWRTELRAAAAARNGGELQRLARSDAFAGAQPESLDLLGRSLQWSGESKEALRVYRIAHLRFPDDHRISHNLANLLIASPNTPWPEVARLLESALARLPDDAHFRADLVIAVRHLNEPETTEALLAELERRHPDYARGWFVAGNAWFAAKRYDRAIECFDRVIALDSGHAPAWGNRGTALNLLGRTDDALESFERSLRIEPSSFEVNMGKGMCLLRAFRKREAIEPLKRALAIRPNDPKALRILGAAYLDLYRIREAIEFLRGSHAADSRNVGTLVTLGYAYTSRGDWKNALEVAERAIEIDETLGEAHNIAGTNLFNLGRFEAALEQLGRAEELGFRPESSFGARNGILTRQVESVIEFDRQFAKLEPDAALRRGEMIYLAGILSCRNRNLESARLFVEAQDLKDGELRIPQLLNAIHVALSVALGEGPAAAKLDEKRRQSWQRQGREWLRDVLDLIEEQPEFGRNLLTMPEDRILEKYRSGPVISALPETDRKVWSELWNRLMRLREQVPN